MPQQSVSIDGSYAADIKAKVELLIDNLVNIKDESGKFLLRLPDGRVIDTKGWNDWEWTHGIGMRAMSIIQQTSAYQLKVSMASGNTTPRRVLLPHCRLLSPGSRGNWRLGQARTSTQWPFS